MSILQWVEFATQAMEALAVFVTVAGIVYGSARFGFALLRRSHSRAAYHEFREFMGSALLLGLEILVAADLVHTIALDPTLQSMAVLGLLVLIRTFLSWSLIVEIEGHWPWREAQAEHARAGRPATALESEARAEGSLPEPA